jgi:hypothetical protein
MTIQDSFVVMVLSAQEIYAVQFVEMGSDTPAKVVMMAILSPVPSFDFKR